MKKYLFIAAVLVSSTAHSFTITTGGKSGSYYQVGNNIAGVLSGVNVVTSKGSVENLDRLKSGEADAALVQMDALAWYTGKNPEMKNQIEILGPLYEECVFVAANPNSKVTDEDDLQSKGATVAIGKPGSGSAVTWDYMIQLESGYKESAIDTGGGVRALGKLAANPDGDVNAVMWVTKPKLDHKLISTVMNNDDLIMLDIDDKDLNDDYDLTGEPIYRFRKIDVKSGLFNDTEIKTICVDAALVARSDADEEMLDGLADLLLNYKSTIVK